MEERDFYHKLHTQLGEKYNLSSSQVNFIRSSVGEKRNKDQIIERLIERIKIYPKNRRNKDITFFQTLLTFLSSCSSEAWNDITQLTEFDRGREAENKPHPTA